MSDDEADALLGWLRRWPRLALAVSGGGDSLALMHLSAEWMARTPEAPQLHVLTVDHGLQPHSAEIAESVCHQAAALHLSCDVLRWTGDKPATGIEAAARKARYDLLAHWCHRHEAALVVAHTLEDQAETFLMRLARGSGVEGLSGMAREARVPAAQPPVPLLRPLLQVPRARLRATLQARGMEWHEDPANSDERHERVRIRRLLPMLTDFGLTASAIATSARRLRRANDALQRQAEAFLQQHVRLHALGWAEVKRPAFDALPEELRLRALAWLIGRLGGSGGTLRDLAGLERMDAWLRQSDADAPRAQVLAGAHIARRQHAIVITREPGRPGAALHLTPDQPRGRWDNRFDIALQGLRAPLRVVMLAEVEAASLPAGLPARPKDTPATAWRAQPAIIGGDGTLLALPATGWQAADAPFGTASAVLSAPGDAWPMPAGARR